MSLASAADICFQPTAYVSTSTVLLQDVAIGQRKRPGRDDAVWKTSYWRPLRAGKAHAARICRDPFATWKRVGVPADELNYSGSSVVVVASADVRLPLKGETERNAESQTGRRRARSSGPNKS